MAAFDDAPAAKLQLAVESFGFKHGLPLDADIVMTSGSSRTPTGRRNSDL